MRNGQGKREGTRYLDTTQITQNPILDKALALERTEKPRFGTRRNASLWNAPDHHDHHHHQRPHIYDTITIITITTTTTTIIIIINYRESWGESRLLLSSLVGLLGLACFSPLSVLLSVLLAGFPSSLSIVLGTHLLSFSVVSVSVCLAEVCSNL